MQIGKSCHMCTKLCNIQSNVTGALNATEGDDNDNETPYMIQRCQIAMHAGKNETLNEIRNF